MGAERNEGEGEAVRPEHEAPGGGRGGRAERAAVLAIRYALAYSTLMSWLFGKCGHSNMGVTGTHIQSFSATTTLPSEGIHHSLLALPDTSRRYLGEQWAFKITTCFTATSCCGYR